MSLSDLEDLEPKESNANGCNAHDRAGEKEQDDQQKDNIIDGEDLRRLDQNPVHRIKDVDVSKNVATVGLANRVLCLVDECQEHGDPDEDRHNDEQYASNQLEGAEERLDLDPRFQQPTVAFPSGFLCKALAADKRPLLSNEGVEFSTIFCRETIITTLISALQLTLSFAILVELGRGVGAQGRGRDSRSRFDKSYWQ